MGEEKTNTMEDKRMVKLEFVFQNCFFGAYIENNQHIHFWVHGHSSLFTFGLHLVRGPKSFVTWFF